jgi:uracil-DNA glycosylase family 4
MDAREQLRQYLEQRREAGERDLVLDGMSVEEAMRLLGAARGVPGKPPATREPAGPRAVAERPPMSEPATGDWREVLRGTGSAPDTAMPVPVSKEPKAAGPTGEPGKLPAGIVIGSPDRSLFSGGTMSELDTLEAVAAAVANCTKCTLHSTAKNPVPGSGNPNAKFMVVGEAPGQSEDEQGMPFVGAAGQLLTKILAAVDLKREDVFICNVLKHRPPGNRNPMPDEVTACSPYLVRQFELLRPKVILALGTFAAQTLLETKLAIGKLRGQLHRYHGVPLIVTYHPAALLRNPSWKRPTWEDVQLARRILDSAVAEP